MVNGHALCEGLEEEGAKTMTTKDRKLTLQAAALLSLRGRKPTEAAIDEELWTLRNRVPVKRGFCGMPKMLRRLKP